MVVDIEEGVFFFFFSFIQLKRRGREGLALWDCNLSSSYFHSILIDFFPPNLFEVITQQTKSFKATELCAPAVISEEEHVVTKGWFGLLAFFLKPGQD